MSTIAERYRRLRAEVGEEVTLVAVSKYHSVSQIAEAYAAGCRDFGESRETELVAKADRLPSDIRWHFIGHLQRNKVGRVVPVTQLIHSVDSLRLLETIDRHAAQAGRTVDCLLQVHVAAEPTKFGFSVPELLSIDTARLTACGHARVAGLMAMATNTDDSRRIEADFRAAYEAFAQLQTRMGENRLRILSMGMSDDYPLAIKQHSNMVRIGSAIFGDPLPDPLT